MRRNERVRTRRGHENELLRFGNGIIMDFDADAATSS